MATVAEPKIVLDESPKLAKVGTLAGDSLATGIIFALAFTVGQRAIGFLRSIVFCRLMTDQELGQWSIVWGFIMLLPPLAMLGLPGCFGKYSEYYLQRGNVRSFIFQIARVTGLTTIVGIGALLIYPSYFAELLLGDSSAVGLLICLAVTLVAVSASNFAASLLESIRQVRVVSIMRFIIVAVFTLVGSLAIVFSEQTVAAVTLAYGVSCLLSMFPAVWLFYRFRKEIFQPATDSLHRSAMWKRILPYAGWLWVSNILNNSMEIADRFMLLKYATVPLEVAQSYVGQYHSSRIIPTLLTSIAAMLGGVLLPYLSKLWEAGRYADAARQQNLTFKLVGIIFTTGGIVVLAFSDFFFENVLQGRYSEGKVVFPLTMVFYTWFSLYTVGQDYLWVAERGRLVSLSLAVGLLASIVLNFVLIPVWGLWGAVVAASFGNFLLLSLLLVMNHASRCPTDSGVWAMVALPLLMLIDPLSAITCLLLVVLLAFRTTWIFSRSEKAIGFQFYQASIAKLLGSEPVR